MLETCGQVQRGPAIVVQFARRGPVLHQHARDVAVAQPRGPVERGLAPLVERGVIGACLQEQLDDVDVTLPDGPVQGRQRLSLPRVGVRSTLQENSHRPGIARLGRRPQISGGPAAKGRIHDATCEVLATRSCAASVLLCSVQLPTFGGWRRSRQCGGWRRSRRCGGWSATVEGQSVVSAREPLGPARSPRPGLGGHQTRCGSGGGSLARSRGRAPRKGAGRGATSLRQPVSRANWLLTRLTN